MAANARLLLLLLVAGLCAAQQERSISSGPRRRNRLPAGKSEVLDFSCPEDFGYYQHPTDCTQYYVCVFGGALQESCSGGLVYSHDLQTCDWPRNVVCNVDLSAPVSTVRVTDPRTAAPPAPRSSLTPSVSNGFADTLRSSGGRKEQLSGPSSNSVNRQGRIISSNDKPQQDVRGRFQLQESTNRAFSVSPTTTSRTFSFPDDQTRQKRAAPDQLDGVTEIGTKSRLGRSPHDGEGPDSGRYPRIVRRGYDAFPQNLADDENFVNFKRPETRSHDFKFFAFDNERPNSPKKTHDFFSLDSIEEDLDRGQSLLVDMEVQEKSDILYHRPASGGEWKRPPANKNNKRAIGPSAFSYNTVKTPIPHHFQDHFTAAIPDAFRSQSLKQKFSGPSSKPGSKFNDGAPSPPFAKYNTRFEEPYDIRPASGYSSSSSANPFGKFITNNNQKHLPNITPVRERPRPMPHVINPFHEYRPVHEYTFGPPNHQKDLKDYEEHFSHHRDITDRPRHPHQFAIAEGHSDLTGKRQPVAEHTTVTSTKLSRPQSFKEEGKNNNHKYFEKAKGSTSRNGAHSTGSFARDPLPTKTSEEFRRPNPTVSSQHQQTLKIYGNDYALHHNAPTETQPSGADIDDFLHPTPGTRYHEELDYPLIHDHYEYDDYFYGEPPRFQSYDLAYADRPDGKNSKLSNWHREPEVSTQSSKEQKNFSTSSRPQFHSIVSQEREPTLPTKLTRNRPPIRPASNSNASGEPVLPRLPTSTEIPQTERPTRPTRPKIHIPVRRHRKTTSTTTTTPTPPPPRERPRTTSKPFTFPPYEKPLPFRGDLRKSVSAKRPIHIPGTARHPELSKLPDSSATSKHQTTDGRFSLKQHSRPALPGAEPTSSFKNQFDSRPQSSQSFSSPQKQQSPAATPAPSTLDDNFYSDLLNLTDAEYFYLYEDLLLEDYFDGSAGSTTPKPTTRAPIRQNNQRSSGSSGSTSAKIDSSRPSRPAPQYPQQTYNTLATKCDRKACRLPDCSCGGKEVPGGLAPQDVPQMVLLTFDDSVNDLNKELYQDLFERGRTNPNGCPLAATFYISHEWTDYSQVQNLYADGHEIASHSITHSFGEQFSKLKWAKEIAGQREIMAAYGGVRMEDVRGMRAPFLAVGGNKMFEMLYEQNFTYDSSMPVYENRPPSYPYTLDYKLFHDCMIPPCPTNSFPGLWEVPMVMWQDLNGGRCSMGDACTTPPDAEGVYKMLIKNFERHYTTNRAPMGLFYHAAWFTTPHHKEGFIAFLDTISGMQDVWLVTNWQALQWMRDPVPISQANNFKPFQCSYPERPARCKSHRVCNVWHKGGVRYMRTCQPCPEAYPWVGSTGVPSPLNDA